MPIHTSDRRFLRFYLNGMHYQWAVLPFGISTSPWLFTQITKPTKQDFLQVPRYPPPLTPSSSTSPDTLPVASVVGLTQLNAEPEFHGTCPAATYPAVPSPLHQAPLSIGVHLPPGLPASSPMVDSGVKCLQQRLLDLAQPHYICSSVPPYGWGAHLAATSGLWLEEQGHWHSTNLELALILAVTYWQAILCHDKWTISRQHHSGVVSSESGDPHLHHH